MSQSQALILIVDDDAELAAMVVRLMVREGWRAHTVLTAGDAERSLAALRPDVVLLDAMLPDANGFDLAHHQTYHHGGQLRVVVNDQDQRLVLRHVIQVYGPCQWPRMRHLCRNSSCDVSAPRAPPTSNGDGARAPRAEAGVALPALSRSKL
jgi:Response regulator receiver domain